MQERSVLVLGEPRLDQALHDILGNLTLPPRRLDENCALPEPQEPAAKVCEIDDVALRSFCLENS